MGEYRNPAREASVVRVTAPDWCQSAAMVDLRSRWAGVALLATGVIFGVASGQPTAAPAFEIPAGWLDLSPGGPPANRELLKPEVLAALQKEGVAAAAFKLPAADAPLTLTFNALVSPGMLRADEDTLSRVRASTLKNWQALTPSARIVAAGIVDVAKVKGLRVETALDARGTAVRQIVYWVPLGDRSTAMLSYSCSEAEAEAVREVFAASANGTRGAAAPGLLAGVAPTTSILRGLAVMGVLIGGWLLGRSRAR